MAINIQSTKNTAMLGLKLLCYGQAGAGKTVLSTTTGGTPLIISAESGLLSIADHDIDTVSVSSIADVHEIYSFMTQSEDARKYDWLILDSISEIAEVVLSTEKKLTKDPRKAYGALQEQMTDLIRAFRDIPINVYMSCKMERVKDEEAGTLLYAPAMPGAKLGQQVPYFFDEVFALRVEKDAEGVLQRWIQTQPDQQYTAKDRSGKLDMFELPNLAAIQSKILSTKE
jgi:phage nucleotide-binding protein